LVARFEDFVVVAVARGFGVSNARREGTLALEAQGAVCELLRFVAGGAGRGARNGEQRENAAGECE
jgi:hypothetical protein